MAPLMRSSRRELLALCCVFLMTGCSQDPKDTVDPQDMGTQADLAPGNDTGDRSDMDDMNDMGDMEAAQEDMSPGDTGQPDMSLGDATEDLPQDLGAEDLDSPEDLTSLDVDDLDSPDSPGDLPQDSGAPDMGVEDLGSDSDAVDMGGGEDPYEGQPTGQCIESADCPETALGAGSCSRALPGGACLGCGTDDHCPSGAVCNFGNCVTECGQDADCPPGLRCTSRGLCAAMPCVQGACPVPLFACNDSDLCERATCQEQADCPIQTTCQSGRCLEDRSLQ